MAAARRVVPLDASRVVDFHRFHERRCDAGWCRCVAWWVPTWDGWGERTAEENRRLRDELFARGEHDGYLCYEGDEPVGWCQAGPRDRLEKLRAQMGLAPDPAAWALSCFLVAPDRRRSGVCRDLLAGVLSDLRGRGVGRVEVYPRHDVGEAEDGEVWNGPLELFLAAGFREESREARRAVLVLRLDRDG